MAKRLSILSYTGIAFVLWILVMGLIVREHYIKKADQELGYFSADVEFDSQTSQYFSIYSNDRKIGYRFERQSSQPEMIMYQSYDVIKMNLAGMSREVFFMSSVGIDSVSQKAKYMDYTIHSGMHIFHCEGVVRNDSLIIDVRLNSESPRRRGSFDADENITFPGALPFFLNVSQSDSLKLNVFDPFVFAIYPVECVRKGQESFFIKNLEYNAVRYDLTFPNAEVTVWLDDNGNVVKRTGDMIFAGQLGSLTIEKAMDRDVFLLPLEVTLGKELIRGAAFAPDKTIPDPRNVQYLEVVLGEVRGANIDLGSSNKVVLSLNPLTLGIHTKPVITGERKAFEHAIALSDTALVGTSDYIQSKDARFPRVAHEIIGSKTDTLTIARTINKWVFDNVKKEKGLDIIRSIDILRIRRGFADEHTKLFTALTRSIGIPTQINLGLACYDGAFRYHSWPSIYTGGEWHSMDPTFGQDVADATHISLIRGDFERSVELIRIFAIMSLKILDHR